MPSRLHPSNRSQGNSTAFGIVQRDIDETTSVISVEGELDLSTAPRLKWMLIDAVETAHTQLVIDLDLVTFIDSTALGVLVGVQRSLDTSAGMAIVCTRANVLNIFEFAGLDGAFAIFATVEEALGHAQGQAAGAG